jgi:aryl-alcohol dehydrogenase-like predicted oxidoreductase
MARTRRRGTARDEVPIAFVTRHPAITSAIIGPRTMKYRCAGCS